MKKVFIDFDTYNKLRELAHEAVDDAIRTIFYTEKGISNRIASVMYNPNDMAHALLEGKMKGFKYRDWDNEEDYVPNFEWEYRYPLTVYGDTNTKKWWVDVHNLSENHPCFYKLMSNLAHRICHPGNETKQLVNNIGG